MQRKRSGTIKGRRQKRAQCAQNQQPKSFLLLSSVLSKFPKSFLPFVSPFQEAFSTRTFTNFLIVLSGLIFCTHTHTISRVIRAAGGIARLKHFTVFYLFFSRAKWELDNVCKILVSILLRTILRGVDEITVPLDDTLCRHTGSHIWGAGMHFDALLSSKSSSGGGRNVHFTFGHDWVVASVWVPLPWGQGLGVAVPVLFRLYRSKKTCPKNKYKKRTELAVEMMRLLRQWIPARVRIIFVVDHEYACGVVVKNLPANTCLVGRMNMDAALHGYIGSRNARGRPRKKGLRLPTPAQMAASPEPWNRKRVLLYGKFVEVRYKSVVAYWPHVAGEKPIVVVVTQDAEGKEAARAFFCTDAKMQPVRVMQIFARRWAQEAMHQQVKEHMGAEEVRNGWWRNRKGEGRSQRRPGAHAKEERGEKAVLRTAPICFLTYSLVTMWYLKKGGYAKDVRAAKFRNPWYQSKKFPAFSDMLFAARREMFEQRISTKAPARVILAEVMECLYGLLQAA